MLTELLVRNIALIDEVSLHFGTGLHALTGETGAGKSIVIDSITLLLGGRASKELIRHGADRAYVEGSFSLQDAPNARAFLTANGQSPKAEFYLPFAVNDMIGRGKAAVQMLTTPDSWHGVTYREDKPEVQRAIRELIDAGVYPEKLYED